MAIVLVTGCSSGIGLETALNLARRGDSVAATMRDPAQGEALTGIAVSERLQLRVLELDLLDAASVERAVSDTAAAFRGLDAVVNNAGIEVQAAIEETTDEDVLLQLETNVVGPVRLIRAALPLLCRSADGVIVNVSSIVATAPRPFGGVYAASKSALEALSEALSLELETFDVRVVVVAPGAYNTSLGANTVTVPHATRSRYDNIRRKWLASFHRFEEANGHGELSEVADAVWRAIHGGTQFRVIVGRDAELITSLRACASFEDYRRAVDHLLARGS